LIAKFAVKESVAFLCHCAGQVMECHRFELQKLIERECGAKA